MTVIGRVKAKSALERWRKTYQTHGTEGLLTERRGKSNAGGGRPKQDDSLEQRLAKAEARIKYLTAENELLKKLEELEGRAKRTD